MTSTIVHSLQDLGHVLRRCVRLLSSSASSFRRLRRICCRLRSRQARAQRTLSERAHAHSQLEEQVVRLRRDAAAGAGAAREAREELARRTRELQEAQAKMNDSYKLMAEISNENLRLAGEKLRVEELLGEVRASSSASSSRRHHHHHHHHRRGGHQQQEQQQQLRSASACGAAAALEAGSGEAVVVTQQQQPQPQQQQQQRSHSSSSRHRHRHYHHQQQHHSRQGGSQSSSRSSRTYYNQHRRHRGEDAESDAASNSAVSSSAVPPAAAAVTGTVPLSAADVSSPDLGVDVSSDPFSSLERAKGYLSESLARGEEKR